MRPVASPSRFLSSSLNPRLSLRASDRRIYLPLVGLAMSANFVAMVTRSCGLSTECVSIDIVPSWLTLEVSQRCHINGQHDFFYVKEDSLACTQAKPHFSDAFILISTVVEFEVDRKSDRLASSRCTWTEVGVLVSLDALVKR